MTDPDLTLATLCTRVSGLEAALRRTRMALAAAALLLVVAFAGGWRAAKDVEAEKVVLTDDAGTPVIVLRGMPGTPMPALVLETPEGGRVLTLGPVVRPVR